MSEPLNIHDLRAIARRRLPRAIFEFIDRGSEDETQLGANRAALDSIRLTPRVLRDVSRRDPSVMLLGRKRPLPLIVAPTGIADLACHRGESRIARAAAAAGVPFALATSSTTALEDIAGIATAGFWMQLYLWDRRDLSWALIERAEAAGAEALVLTVDTPVLPNREFNQRNGMANPPRANPRLALDFLAHPRWLAGVLARYWLSGGLPRFANYPASASSVTGKGARIGQSASVCWVDLAELRRRWPRKLLVKGILHPDDARLAARHGADGVIVSNHGGRNFDAGPAAIDALGPVVDAAGGEIAVLFDSGVRRGTDVLKAIAIGADAVLVGRPTLYGAASGGEAGAARAIAILAKEIDFAMAMLGVSRLDGLDRSFLA